MIVANEREKRKEMRELEKALRRFDLIGKFFGGKLEEIFHEARSRRKQLKTGEKIDYEFEKVEAPDIGGDYPELRIVHYDAKGESRVVARYWSTGSIQEDWPDGN